MARQIDNSATVIILSTEERTALGYLLRAFRDNPDLLMDLTEKNGLVFGDEGHRETITKLWDELFRTSNITTP